MTGTSHVLTGIAVASLARQPVVALPVAVVSHFVCDALPHFGYDRKWLKKHKTLVWWLIRLDGFTMLSILTFLLFSQHILYFFAAIAAFSPDLVWVVGYFRGRAIKSANDKDVLSKFHVAIQRLERPSGWVFELGYISTVLILIFLLQK